MVVNEIDYAVEALGTLKGALQIEGGWKYVLRPINPFGFVEQMYNVIDDPTESHGLKNEHPDIFEAMQAQFSVSVFCFYVSNNKYFMTSLGFSEEFGIE